MSNGRNGWDKTSVKITLILYLIANTSAIIWTTAYFRGTISKDIEYIKDDVAELKGYVEEIRKHYLYDGHRGIKADRDWKNQKTIDQDQNERIKALEKGYDD